MTPRWICRICGHEGSHNDVIKHIEEKHEVEMRKIIDRWVDDQMTFRE